MTEFQTAMGDALGQLDGAFGETWTVSATARVGRWGRVIEEVIPTETGTIRNAIRSLTVRKSVYSAALAVNTEVTHQDGSRWRVRGAFSEDSLSRTWELISLK